MIRGGLLGLAGCEVVFGFCLLSSSESEYEFEPVAKDFDSELFLLMSEVVVAACFLDL